MGIGVGEEHEALAAAVTELATDLGAAAVVKASETDGPAAFGPLDDGVAVEAAAAGMVPGTLLSTVVAGWSLRATSSPGSPMGR